MAKLTAGAYVLDANARAQATAQDRGRLAVWFALLREGFTPLEANRLILLKIQHQRDKQAQDN